MMAQFDSLKSFIITHAQRWIVALIILVIGLLAAKLSKRWLNAILNRSRVRDDLLLKNFFSRSVSVAIIISAILIALDCINIPITSFIAGLGITGIILGFALRDTFASFAAGLLLLIYRPFRAGELIEVEGAQGIVEELTIVNMQMTTTDGVRVILPNSKVWGSKIVNYSLSKRRRLEMTVKVRQDDVELAISAIHEALAEDPRILKTPEPLVRVTSVTDDAAMLSVWGWTDAETFQQVSADEYLRILNQFRRAELQVL